MRFILLSLIFFVFYLNTLSSKTLFTFANESFVQYSQNPSTNIHLTIEEHAWLKAHPIVNVAVRHGYSPIEFIFELQDFRGISIDYLKKL